MRQQAGLNALKVLMILFVIFIHENPSYSTHGDVVMWWNSIVVVAVPVFFVLSGYFFFKGITAFDLSTYKAKLTQRARTLLIPYLIWNCMPVLFVVAGNLYSIIFRGKSIDDLVAFLTGLWNDGLWHIWWDKTSGTMPFDCPLWYVRDLMILCLLSPVLYYAIRYLKWSISLIFAMLYLADIQLPIGFSLTGILFFSLGSTFALLDVPLNVIAGKEKMLLFFLTLLTFIIYIFMDLTVIHQLFIILSCYSWILLFYDLKGEFINRIGRLSEAVFFVFALHFSIIIVNVGKVVNKVFTGSLSFISYWIIPFITLFVCIILYYVIKRMFPKLISVLCGGR